MATEKQQREIQHQQELGKRGISTGNLYNSYGVEQYKEKKARHEKMDRDFWKAHSSTCDAASKMGIEGPNHGSDLTSQSGGHLAGKNNDGFIQNIAEWLAKRSEWFVENIQLLDSMQSAGKYIYEIGWKPRLPLTMLGIIAGIVFASSTGNSLIISAAGLLGGAAGWFLFNLFGMLIIFATYLAALTLVLSLIAVATSIVYLIVAFFACWFPFSHA